MRFEKEKSLTEQQKSIINKMTIEKDKQSDYLSRANNTIKMREAEIDKLK